MWTQITRSVGLCVRLAVLKSNVVSLTAAATLRWRKLKTGPFQSITQRLRVKQGEGGGGGEEWGKGGED